MSKRFRLFALAFLAAIFAVALCAGLLESPKDGVIDAVDEVVPAAPVEAPESPARASAEDTSSETLPAPFDPEPPVPEAKPDVRPNAPQPAYEPANERPRRGIFRRGRRG